MQRTTFITYIHSAQRLLLHQILTLTPELGPGVTSGARLTRVVFSTGLLSIKNPSEGYTCPAQRIFASTNWRHLWDPLFNLPKRYRMAGPEPITPSNEGTTNQNTTRDIIKRHLSALKELLKEPNNRNLIKPLLLDFDDIQDVSDDEIQGDVKGKAKTSDEDLRKPFKEVLKCPFTRRIIKFSSLGHRMPANAKIYDGTGDPEDHMSRFVGIGNQREWPMPVWCRMFQQTLDGKARAWFDKLPPGSIDN
ncbi:hypothetical protein Tco_1231043 [Tanacetum coccineum]